MASLYFWFYPLAASYQLFSKENLAWVQQVLLHTTLLWSDWKDYGIKLLRWQSSVFQTKFFYEFQCNKTVQWVNGLNYISFTHRDIPLKRTYFPFIFTLQKLHIWQYFSYWVLESSKVSGKRHELFELG